MPVFTSVGLALGALAATAAVGAGASIYNAQKQAKATKSAASKAAASQNALLKAAEEKSASQEATSASAVAKARQKALAAATAQTGRSGTIKTGSQLIVMRH